MLKGSAGSGNVSEGVGLHTFFFLIKWQHVRVQVKRNEMGNGGLHTDDVGSLEIYL